MPNEAFNRRYPIERAHRLSYSKVTSTAGISTRGKPIEPSVCVLSERWRSGRLFPSPSTFPVPSEMMSSWPLNIVLAAGIALASTGAATAESPSLDAQRLDQAPVVDGEIVDDDAWQGRLTEIELWQTTPDEGDPASQRTEIAVGFTDDTLYLAVVCHDDSPEEIIVSDSRRDASLVETDSFQVIFDTFRDLQSGFVFGTNPAGIEYDGQVASEGQGGSSPSGQAGGFNRNWDGDWEVATAISEIGWSAEFAIPFRTLRFGRGKTQTWGLNFQRNIRRRNENSYWAPLPRQFNLYRLSLAGTLEGVEVPSQRNLQIVPYALAIGERAGIEGADEETDTEAGIDIKWSVTPSLTLDATYNTDFAQVEADEQQINLDRFNLFFPEKRPFFLENAGSFTVGVPQEVELFFSRRIGIGPRGQEIPVRGGLRLSGKAGAFNVGLLHMRTEEVESVAPENDFTVARLSRELPNRSSLGVLVTHRDGGSGVDGDDTNLTIGVDGRWGIGRYGQIIGFAAKTDTPDLDGEDHAFRIGASYDSEGWSLGANYTEVGEDFNPEVGFLARDSYRKIDLRIFHRYRPDNWLGLHELRPHVSYSGFWDQDSSFQQSGFLHVDNHWEWKSGHEIHTGINFTREGVSEPFEISPGVIVPAGTYDHEEAALVFFTNRGAPVRFILRATIGGFFGGDRQAYSPGVRFRVGEQLNGEVRWTYNDIDLPAGAFDTHLGRLRFSYSFTPKLFVETLVQYNDQSDDWSTNLRFGWLQRAGAGFYVVYNETRDIGSAGTGIPDRSLIVKFSRLIDVLR